MINEIVQVICQECGYYPYLPHKNTSPLDEKDLTPREIDNIDRTAVTVSRVVIACVSIPSLGVGVEIEMANHANKPVILISDEEHQVSRLVRGNPAVIDHIAFHDSEKTLRQKLPLALSRVRKQALGLPSMLRFV
jgi:C4-type Zn-finger protein